MTELREKYVNPADTDKKREKLFEVAEIAKFTPDQVRSYEDSLKNHRDMKASIETCYEEGREREIKKVAFNLLTQNIDIEIIKQAMGLTETQIQGFKHKPFMILS